MGSRTLAVVGDGRVGFYLVANDSGESPRKLQAGADAPSGDGNGEMRLAGPCVENNLCMVVSKD
jgi:hypothetical protein